MELGVIQKGEREEQKKRREESEGEGRERKRKRDRKRKRESERGGKRGVENKENEGERKFYSYDNYSMVITATIRCYINSSYNVILILFVWHSCAGQSTSQTVNEPTLHRTLLSCAEHVRILQSSNSTLSLFMTYSFMTTCTRSYPWNAVHSKEFIPHDVTSLRYGPIPAKFYDIRQILWQMLRAYPVTKLENHRTSYKPNVTRFVERPAYLQSYFHGLHMQKCYQRVTAHRTCHQTISQNIQNGNKNSIFYSAAPSRDRRSLADDVHIDR